MINEKRKECSLDGWWECYDAPFSATVEELPQEFVNQIPVPGLFDMAKIPFAYTADAETLRGLKGEYEPKALWYKKKVFLEELSENILLKIHKGFWGKEVYVNGSFVARHEPNFTPVYLTISRFLRLGENEILIKVGEKNTQNRELGHPTGFDAEKKKFIPGLYDSVELLFCGNPKIDYLQVAPDIDKGEVLLACTVTNTSFAAVETAVQFFVCDGDEVKSEGRVEGVSLQGGETKQVRYTLPMYEFTCWSPENPYRYQAIAATDGDSIRTDFGMRKFAFVDKIPMLNNEIYYLRGTNIVTYRFFEDALRGSLPWDREWVKRLLLKFKSLRMNSLRFHISFPPDFWYDICDEIGILVDDEYPIFGAYECPIPVCSETLVKEFTDWIYERANHPCVFLWDAQNECANEPFNGFVVDSASLIRSVRHLDLSNRPWDNGWDYPEGKEDSIEVHPYLFIDPNFYLSKLNGVDYDPAKTLLCPDWHNLIARKEENPFPEHPRIVNEYSWLWISRQGKPCRLTETLYKNLFPNGFTERELRDYYAYAIAALTEFWRVGRKTAGIYEFCGLSYSREGGETSDNFLPDIANPTYDPEFERRMYSAFAPVGIIVEDWAETRPLGKVERFAVSLVNDLAKEFSTEVRVELFLGGELLSSQRAEYFVAGGGRTTKVFEVNIPQREGKFTLLARYTEETGKDIESARYFCGGEEIPNAHRR